MVPAPLRPRTARPQLGPPGRPHRARGDPPLLVRAGRRRRPHRLRRPARQGPGPARLHPGQDPHPYLDRDELHDIYRSWRAVADRYGAVFVGEVWLPDSERFARYLRPDELHTAFNFAFLSCPWEPERLRAAIRDTLAEHAPVGAPATWVLCNHDITRTVTRYGRAETGFDFAAKRFGTPTDPALGTRRARAAALLSLALPGATYLYQGEELGLPEAEIPREHIEDPMHARSGGVDPGRDGCRVPLPWTADAPHAGFSTGEPWLPQPPAGPPTPPTSRTATPPPCSPSTAPPSPCAAPPRPR